MREKWLIVFVTLFIITLIFVLFQSTTNDDQAYENINLAEYNEKLKEKEDFFVYIYSPKCLSCKNLAPALNSIIKKTGTKVFALDISKEKNNNKDFFKKHKIELTPTLISYKGGAEKSRKIGKVSENNLKIFLEK